MKDDVLMLRQVQSRVAALLSESGRDIARMIRSAFPVLDDGAAHGAIQQVTLEVAADLSLRFTCEYRVFPYRLVQMADESLCSTTVRPMGQSSK